jgi:hypothetical protein
MINIIHKSAVYVNFRVIFLKNLIPTLRNNTKKTLYLMKIVYK